MCKNKLVSECCRKCIEDIWLNYYDQRDKKSLMIYIKERQEEFLFEMDDKFGLAIPFEMEDAYLNKLDSKVRNKVPFYEFAWEYNKVYQNYAKEIGNVFYGDSIIEAFFSHGDRAKHGVVESILAIADAYEKWRDNHNPHTQIWRERAADLGDVESMKWLVAFYSKPGFSNKYKVDEWRRRIEDYYNKLS